MAANILQMKRVLRRSTVSIVSLLALYLNIDQFIIPMCIKAYKFHENSIFREFTFKLNSDPSKSSGMDAFHKYMDSMEHYGTQAEGCTNVFNTLQNVFFLVAICLLAWWIKRGYDEDVDESCIRDSNDNNNVTLDIEVVQQPFGEVNMNIDYNEVMAACKGFDESYKIGNGHYSEVYTGVLQGRQVAVKKMLLENLRQDFMTEVKTISRARHRNVVPLLGYSLKKDESPLLIFPRLKTSLSNLLKDEEVTWSTRCKIALGVAKGLHYLHNEIGSGQSVVHCDIKPANILMDRDNNPYISDFGLAKLIDISNGGITCASTWRGTPGYVAPEADQDVNGFNRTVSPKWDVYSYGVLLFVLITGKLDVVNCSVRLMLTNGTVDSQLICDPKYNRLQAEKLRVVALSCIEKDPADRPSMADVLYRLNFN